MPTQEARRSFPSRARLKRRSDFRAVFSQGSSRRRNGIALHFLERKNARESRLGIIVSKSSLKRANRRNLFKRVARELFRNERKRFKSAYDLLVRWIGGPRKMDKRDLREHLRLLFKEARL